MKKLQRFKDNVEVAFFWGAALSLVGIALTACVVSGVVRETLDKARGAMRQKVRSQDTKLSDESTLPVLDLSGEALRPDRSEEN